ncbi:hypothetical protein VNI00_015512 [Paramarasmius palmivorus]|uniref:Uncharacterized protein n=1 Tax=Paramarasmius palmivorus TaxID=297713 RepID=A0AAW0BJL3_9AGAR
MIPTTPQRSRAKIPRITGHKGMDYLLAASYKAVLFFPHSDEPRLVRLQRDKIAAFDFRPLLDPDDQEDGGTAHIKGVRSEGAEQGFRVFYFEQTARNTFPINECVTRELQGFTDGLQRPWLGPIVVDWYDDNVLTAENLQEKVEEMIINIHNFYEDFVRDESVPFDRLELGSSDEDVPEA